MWLAERDISIKEVNNTTKTLVEINLCIIAFLLQNNNNNNVNLEVGNDDYNDYGDDDIPTDIFLPTTTITTTTDVLLPTTSGGDITLNNRYDLRSRKHINYDTGPVPKKRKEREIVQKTV
nr:8282_t:CDS:2 [Entrophospora candida]